ncbi:MAG: HAD family phosphatase [Oscillospiraceae bacterium]|jgi:HAD superfamily hydrolase (TIGR01509 family)|nr:HAD family phosphatase [Oscillospiraceae bacterium]
MTIEKRSFAAAIFDMDGLMFDTERMHIRSWIGGAAMQGGTLTANDLMPLRGLPARIFCERMVALLPPGADVDKLLLLKRELMADELRTNGVPQKPGLVALLEELRKQGIPAAVATSTPRDVAGRMLQTAGVRDYFAAIVFGDEVQNGKPAPDIFLKAAEKLGVLPQDCLALEDAPNGATAAIRAGMKTVMVPDLDEPPKEIRGQLFAVAESLADVVQLL